MSTLKAHNKHPLSYNEQLEQRKMISSFSMESILNMLNKSPHAILSERFLLHSYERTTTIIDSLLAAQSKLKEPFRPLLVLFFLCCAIGLFFGEVLSDIVLQDYHVVFIMNIAAIFLVSSFLNILIYIITDQLYFGLTFSLISLSLFIVLTFTNFRQYFFLENKYCLAILGSLHQKIVALIYTGGLCIFWPLYSSFSHLAVKNSIAEYDDVHFSLEKMLEEALATSGKAKAEEISTLIKEYVPAYDKLLKKLQVKNKVKQNDKSKK